MRPRAPSNGTKEHLPGKLVKAAERREERQANSLIDQLDALLARAKALLGEVFPEQRQNGQAVKPRDVAAALREMRETLLLMGRMTGQLKGDGATVNVETVVAGRNLGATAELSRPRCRVRRVAPNRTEQHTRRRLTNEQG